MVFKAKVVIFQQYVFICTYLFQVFLFKNGKIRKIKTIKKDFGLHLNQNRDKSQSEIVLIFLNYDNNFLVFYKPYKSPETKIGIQGRGYV